MSISPQQPLVQMNFVPLIYSTKKGYVLDTAIEIYGNTIFKLI